MAERTSVRLPPGGRRSCGAPGPMRKTTTMILPWAAGVAALAIAAAALWLYAPDKSRAALEAAYPGDYRTVDGVRLRLRDTGSARDAPAVILLHGFGASLDTWDPWAQGLVDALSGDPVRSAGLRPDRPRPHRRLHRRARDEDPGRPDGPARRRRAPAWSATRWAGASPGPSPPLHPDRVDRLVLISPDGFASPGFEYGKAPKTPLLMQVLPYVAAARPAAGQPGAGLRATRTP